MPHDLKDKTAIVTGAAQGIGRAIAETLALAGARVVVADIKEAEGRAAAESVGARASFIKCDIADYDQVQSLIDRTVALHGTLDIMVNNAGINTSRKEERVTTDRFPLEVWHRIVDVNLNGTFYCCRAAASQMVKQGRGVIINIASVAGVVALRLQVPFVAAKAAIIKMTESMACELGPLGVRVNAVSPGSTLTEGTRKLFYADKSTADHFTSFIPQRRPGDVQEIAEVVAFLASDAAAYIQGQNIIVDGGWTCGFSRDF